VQLGRDATGAYRDVKEFFDLLDKLKGSGADIGKQMPGGEGIVGAIAQKTREVVQDTRDLKEALARPGGLVFDPFTLTGPAFSVNPNILAHVKMERERAQAIAESAKQQTALIRGDHATHEGEIGAQAQRGDARAAAETYSLAERKAGLDQADLAGKRGLEVVQHQITVLQRQNLDLVKEQAVAELALIPIKQQQAALDLKLLQTSDRRAQLAREGAVTAARLASLPATQALEDVQYQQDFLQAKFAADAMSGQGINPADIDEIVRLARLEPTLRPGAMQAGHDVTLAERDQHKGQLSTDLATLPMRMDQASMAEAAAEAQLTLDAINSALRTELLGKVDELVDYQKAVIFWQEKLYDISQKRQDIATGTILNLSMTVNEAGQRDDDALLRQLADALQRGLDRGTSNTGGNTASSTVPGGGY